MFDRYREELTQLSGAEVMGFVNDSESYGLVLTRGKTVFTLWFYTDEECNGPGAFIIEREDTNEEMDNAGVLRNVIGANA